MANDKGICFYKLVLRRRGAKDVKLISTGLIQGKLATLKRFNGGKFTEILRRSFWHQINVFITHWNKASPTEFDMGFCQGQKLKVYTNKTVIHFVTASITTVGSKGQRKWRKDLHPRKETQKEMHKSQERLRFIPIHALTSNVALRSSIYVCSVLINSYITFCIENKRRKYKEKRKEKRKQTNKQTETWDN